MYLLTNEHISKLPGLYSVTVTSYYYCCYSERTRINLGTTFSLTNILGSFMKKLLITTDSYTLKFWIA